MWVEEEVNSKGKKIFRFREEYEDSLTGKTKKVSVVYARNNRRIRKKALLELNDIIKEKQRTSAADMTFGELVDDWLIDYKDTVKIGTYYIVENKTKQIGKLNDILLPQLTAAHINRYLRNLKQKGLSRSTINGYASMFRQVIGFGLDYGELTDRELLSDIKTPTVSKTKNVKDWKYLEQNELDSLVTQLRALGYEETARMALLQTYTGTRHSELTAINYETNIDWTDKTILIDRTYVPSAKEFNLPKNSKARTIHFNDETEELLKEQIQYTKLKTFSNGLSKDPILFRNSRGRPIVTNSLAYIFDKVDIPGKQISTHIFRHTFIARAIEQNVPIHLIAKHVGDTIQTVDDHYRHFTEKMEEQLKDELQNMSFGN